MLYMKEGTQPSLMTFHSPSHEFHFDGCWQIEGFFPADFSDNGVPLKITLDGKPSSVCLPIAPAHGVDAISIVRSGPIEYPRLVVAFNLLELRENDAAHVGSFASLSAILPFLKHCRISQIHVRISTLPESALLLDPLQLILYSPDRDSFDQMRLGKILWGRGDYTAHAMDAPFLRFKSLYGWLFQSLCPTEADLYVQYRCYQQLFTSFDDCLWNEIAVITDVAVRRDLAELTWSLAMYSQFSNAIRVTGPLSLSEPYLEQILGVECARMVINAFFKRVGNTLQVNPKTRDRLDEAIVFFEPEYRKIIYPAVRDLFQRQAISCEPVMHPEFPAEVAKVASRVSAALVVDDNFARDPRLKELAKSSNLFIASDARSPVCDTKTMYSIPPKTMKNDARAIREDLAARMELGTPCCEIELDKLLFAAGILPKLEKNIPGLLNFTVDGLKNQENADKLWTFVTSLNQDPRVAGARSFG
jgi:hypothetical protein